MTLIAVLMLGACASPGINPQVDLNKNQTLTLGAVMSAEDAVCPFPTSPITVNMIYYTTSSQAIDAALQQRLEDLLKADVKVPLPIP